MWRVHRCGCSGTWAAATQGGVRRSAVVVAGIWQAGRRNQHRPGAQQPGGVLCMHLIQAGPSLQVSGMGGSAFNVNWAAEVYSSHQSTQITTVRAVAGAPSLAPPQPALVPACPLQPAHAPTSWGATQRQLDATLGPHVTPRIATEPVP